jgi:hypothetical protein
VSRLGGPSGPPRRGPCPVSVFKRGVFGLGFLQVLSGVSPVVKGDPQGCPRQSSLWPSDLTPMFFKLEFVRKIGIIKIEGKLDTRQKN